MLLDDDNGRYEKDNVTGILISISSQEAEQKFPFRDWCRTRKTSRNFLNVCDTHSSIGRSLFTIGTKATCTAKGGLKMKEKKSCV